MSSSKSPTYLVTHRCTLSNPDNFGHDLISRVLFSFFFCRKGLDFEAVYACKVPSPYKPKITGPGDVSNFDKYKEQKVEWLGDGKDGFDDMFVGF